jgi:hypothetical protein
LLQPVLAAGIILAVLVAATTFAYRRVEDPATVEF